MMIIFFVIFGWIVRNTAAWSLTEILCHAFEQVTQKNKKKHAHY